MINKYINYVYVAISYVHLAKPIQLCCLCIRLVYLVGHHARHHEVRKYVEPKAEHHGFEDN